MVEEKLRRFGGVVPRDSTTVIRITGLNRGDVCGGATLTGPGGRTQNLAVATADSGTPANTGADTRTDVDALAFSCAP